MEYNIGDIIEFGSYPYEADGTKKDIEWQILEKYNDGTALLISRHGIESVNYNKYKRVNILFLLLTETVLVVYSWYFILSMYGFTIFSFISSAIVSSIVSMMAFIGFYNLMILMGRVTWETSTIRKWLRNYFYEKAFSAAEKSLIMESNVENKHNAVYGTKGGKNTKDKVFLLSIDEANKLFDSDKARRVRMTPYARTKHNDGGSAWWWLRSPGGDRDRAAAVNPGGSVITYGDRADDVRYSLRPAIKINLNSL